MNSLRLRDSAIAMQLLERPAPRMRADMALQSRKALVQVLVFVRRERPWMRIEREGAQAPARRASSPYAASGRDRFCSSR